jgi:hypothetical protein
LLSLSTVFPFSEIDSVPYFREKGVCFPFQVNENKFSFKDTPSSKLSLKKTFFVGILVVSEKRRVSSIAPVLDNAF